MIDMAEYWPHPWHEMRQIIVSIRKHLLVYYGREKDAAYFTELDRLASQLGDPALYGAADDT